MNILIADDTVVVRKLAALVLEQGGHTVKVVDDGDKVVEFLNTLPPPDLVITDFNMPRMDGLEVLRHIRNDVRFKTLPVIVYTTNNYVEFKSQIETLGGVLVNKMPKELLVAVDTIAVAIAKERK